MSVQQEMDRLDVMGRDDALTPAQRKSARDAWDKLNDDLILDDWQAIEAQGAQLDALTQQLATIVDNIRANRLTTVVDDVNAFGDEVRQRAQGDGGS